MKKYEEVTIEIIKFSDEDIISTSGFDSTDDSVDGW